MHDRDQSFGNRSIPLVSGVRYTATDAVVVTMPAKR
jgi:hypothetical protein